MKTFLDLLFFATLPFMIIAALPLLMTVLEMWPVYLVFALIIGAFTQRHRAF